MTGAAALKLSEQALQYALECSTLDGCSSEVTMLNDGTVLIVDSDDKTRDIVFEGAVKHGEIPISCSSCGESSKFTGATVFQGCFLQRQSSP